MGKSLVGSPQGKRPTCEVNAYTGHDVRGMTMDLKEINFMI